MGAIAGAAHNGALTHGDAGRQAGTGTGTAAGTGTGTGTPPKPEQNTPGEPAYEGPAMAQLGMVPQPNGATAVLNTPEPQRGPPTEAPRAADEGPQPQARPLSPKPGPKKFAVEGADTRSNKPILKAVTNAFLAISINPPLYQLLVEQNK